MSINILPLTLSICLRFENVEELQGAKPSTKKVKSLVAFDCPFSLGQQKTKNNCKTRDW